MERKEFIQLLKEIGIREELIEMPAVVEPIYEYIINISAKQDIDFLGISKKEEIIKNTREHIKILDNGNFDFLQTRYLKNNRYRGNKTNITYNESSKNATIKYDNVIITTNEYGIETSFHENIESSDFREIRREDGRLIILEGNDNDDLIYKYATVDNGSWNIQNAQGFRIPTTFSEEYNIELMKEQMAIAEVSKEDMLLKFDEATKVMSDNYPKTTEWSNSLRKRLEEIIPKEFTPVEMANRKIQELETEIKRLENQSKKLTTMLERSLNFIDKIKKHPIGQIFFRKQYEEFEESKKQLDTREEK